VKKKNERGQGGTCRQAEEWGKKSFNSRVHDVCQPARPGRRKKKGSEKSNREGDEPKIIPRFNDLRSLGKNRREPEREKVIIKEGRRSGKTGVRFVHFRNKGRGGRGGCPSDRGAEVLGKKALFSRAGETAGNIRGRFASLDLFQGFEGGERESLLNFVLLLQSSPGYLTQNGVDRKP